MPLTVVSLLLKEALMFHRILVPLDGSVLAESVLPHAIAFARAFDAQVTLLRVLEPPTDEMVAVDPFSWQMAKVEVRTYLDAIVQRLQEIGLSADMLLLEGRAADAVVNYVHNDGIDLIVLSSHGASGLSAWNISSVAQKVIQRATCSVLLLRAYHPAPTASGTTIPTPFGADMRYQRILLPLDGSPRAECVLSPAQRLSRYYNAECTLVHVVQKPAMPRRLPLTAEEKMLVERIVTCNWEKAKTYIAELQNRLEGDIHTTILVDDDVAETLHGVVDQEQVDLVVLSAHGYSGKRRWPYGAITSSFIHHGTTALLFVQDLAQTERPLSQAEMLTLEQPGHGRVQMPLVRAAPNNLTLDVPWHS